jgi:hypothetical protein
VEVITILYHKSTNIVFKRILVFYREKNIVKYMCSSLSRFASLSTHSFPLSQPQRSRPHSPPRVSISSNLNHRLNDSSKRPAPFLHLSPRRFALSTGLCQRRSPPRAAPPPILPAPTPLLLPSSCTLHLSACRRRLPAWAHAYSGVEKRLQTIPC